MFKFFGQPLQAENFFATGDAGHTGAHHFQHARRAYSLDKAIKLAAVAGQLNGINRAGYVDNLAPEDIHGALDFRTLGTGCLQLDQHQLTLDVGTFGQVYQLDHFNQLVQLLGDLLDNLVGTAGGDGQARQGLVFGRRHGQRFDVRSEEHTSELQSRPHLVCRLLLQPPPRSTLFPYTTLFRSQLDQHQLTLDVGTFGQVYQLDHFNQLVQLLGDLLDNLVGTAGGDGQARQGLVFGRRHGQRFDVVVALGKQPNHAGQCARLVFKQNRNDSTHDHTLSVLLSHISFMEPRATCIGYTCSKRST